MEPNDQYLCIVPGRGRNGLGKVFLPFEGDQMLALILSKAFLLAEDDKIDGPDDHGPGRRRAVTSISIRIRGSSRPQAMHRRRRPDLAEARRSAGQHGSKSAAVGQQVADAHHVGERAARLGQRGRRCCARHCSACSTTSSEIVIVA